MSALTVGGLFSGIGGIGGPVVSTCTCDVRAPTHEGGQARSISSYGWRVDVWDDDTTFDPTCPFHGETGSMVVSISGLLLVSDDRSSQP